MVLLCLKEGKIGTMEHRRRKWRAKQIFLCLVGGENGRKRNWDDDIAFDHDFQFPSSKSREERWEKYWSQYPCSQLTSYHRQNTKLVSSYVPFSPILFIQTIRTKDIFPSQEMENSTLPFIHLTILFIDKRLYLKVIYSNILKIQ